MGKQGSFDVPQWVKSSLQVKARAVAEIDEAHEPGRKGRQALSAEVPGL